MDTSVRNFRELHGLSQAEMALLTGANLSLLKKTELESGSLKEETGQRLDRINELHALVMERYDKNLSVPDWARPSLVRHLQKLKSDSVFHLPRLQKNLEDMETRYRQLFILMELVSLYAGEQVEDEENEHWTGLVYLTSQLRKKIQRVSISKQLSVQFKISMLKKQSATADQYLLLLIQ